MNPKEILRGVIKQYCTDRQKRNIIKGATLLKRSVWWMLNPWVRRSYIKKKGLDYHLGCNDIRYPSFVNVDLRCTIATQFTMDLDKPFFLNNSVHSFFSVAFFEHLFRDKRVEHLKNTFLALEENGHICYMGIPYFKNIAKYYLEEGPGTCSEKFDLFNVYRYTHGDPEARKSWYMAQLHKSLFDEEELNTLLKDAGYRNFLIFSYAFPGDLNPVPINLGFYAKKQETSENENLKCELDEFLKPFENEIILKETLEFL